jgi:hypothetical protein
MVRTIFKAKTSRVNRAVISAPPSDASAYCRDLDNWPRSWVGLEKDLPPGAGLVACLRPFIEHLASSSLSPKTIRQHVGNLWTLGGEIIRDLNCIPSLRKVAAQRLLRDASSCRRRPTDPQRLGRGATLPGCDLPQTPQLPQPTSALSPPITHEFHERAL